MSQAWRQVAREPFVLLPKFLRPTHVATGRQQQVFVLVGLAILYAGYDLSIYSLAMPQIQKTFLIPEGRLGLTLSFFRIGAVAALFLASMADVVGRRRLLLITIVGQASATFASAFGHSYNQFVVFQVIARIFGFTEEMVCLVVIAEEMGEQFRGWANGSLAALYFVGSSLASMVFAMVNILPFGWRAIYVLGSVPLFAYGYMRRRLPETKRFEERKVQGLQHKASRFTASFKGLALRFPGRLSVIIAAVCGFGFAFAPASALSYKYMQQSLGYSPPQTTMLFLLGGLAAVSLSVYVGRLSDVAGRRVVIISMVLLSSICFFAFYSGAKGWIVPPIWVLAYFGYFSADALLSGYALEIFPTEYRATISGLRLAFQLLMGAASLAIEGLLYQHFKQHATAVSIALTAAPITVIAILLLPEPAGRTLEEIAGY